MEQSNEEVINEIDLDQLRKEKPNLNGHRWRQRGTQLICTTCPFTHSTYIAPNLRLTGIDEDGLPIIKQF